MREFLTINWLSLNVSFKNYCSLSTLVLGFSYWITSSIWLIAAVWAPCMDSLKYNKWCYNNKLLISFITQFYLKKLEFQQFLQKYWQRMSLFYWGLHMTIGIYVEFVNFKFNQYKSRIYNISDGKTICSIS